MGWRHCTTTVKVLTVILMIHATHAAAEDIGTVKPASTGLPSGTHTKNSFSQQWQYPPNAAIHPAMWQVCLWTQMYSQSHKDVSRTGVSNLC